MDGLVEAGGECAGIIDIYAERAFLERDLGVGFPLRTVAVHSSVSPSRRRPCNSRIVDGRVAFLVASICIDGPSLS